MDEQQLQQQIVQLVQAAMQGDQQATQQIQQIMQAAQQGDQQAAQLAQMIQAVAQQMQQQQQQQQVRAARFGAKLNYIKQLRGECPDGYEMKVFRQGGQLCKKCMKKHQDGGQAEPQSIAKQFTSARCGKKLDMAKCGRKTPKKQQGGGINNNILYKRRPFTGFEGLEYSYEKPFVGYGRDTRPESETIKSGNKTLANREQWYDVDDQGNYYKDDEPGYWFNGMDEVETEYEPSEQQIRLFNSLKRHALLNNRYK